MDKMRIHRIDGEIKYYEMEEGKVLAVGVWVDVSKYSKIETNPKKNIWVIDRPKRYESISKALNNYCKFKEYGFWYMVKYEEEGICKGMIMADPLSSMENQRLLMLDGISFPMTEDGNEVMLRNDFSLEETLETKVLPVMSDKVFAFIYASGAGEATRSMKRYYATKDLYY